MNSLSWVLYFADIVTPISFTFTMVGCSIFVWVGVVAINNTMTVVKHKLSTKSVVIATLMTTTALLLPSKNAIYMIAASEVAGSVVSSEKGQEVLDKTLRVINKKLDGVIDEPNNKGEK